MLISDRDAYLVWIRLLKELIGSPVVNPRGMKCREQLGVQLKIDQGLQNIIADSQRKLNYKFLVGQWLATLVGADEKTLLPYNKYIADFESDGQGGKYPSYGPRLLPQWPFVLKSLLDDKDSRQAVASIWEAQGEPIKRKHTYEHPSSENVENCWCNDPSESNYEPRYVPCTLSLQFLRRPNYDGGERLVTIVTMRSSDAWLGIPYDVYNFTMLANVLAAGLSQSLRKTINVGEIILNLGSSHLYEQHWETARSIVNAPNGKALSSPRLMPSHDQHFFPLRQLITREPTELAPSDWEWWPWPWKNFAGVLAASSQTEALERLIQLDRRAGGVE